MADKIPKKLVDRYKEYRTKPLLWVKDMFGENLKKEFRAYTGFDSLTDTGLTKQQEDAFRQLGELIDTKLAVFYGQKLTEQQLELSKKIGMSIMSGTGCHAKGTQILMFDGTIKKVEDIAVGDLLMGNDSSSRKVLSLCRGREMMYRIQYKNGEYYDVNESHILSLRCNLNHANKYRKGDIHNITVRDYLKLGKKEKHVFKGYKERVNFLKKEQELPIPPYILGLWLGDGCKTLPMIVSLDEEIINEFIEYGASLELNYRNYKIKEHYISNGYRGRKPNIFKDKLREIGVFDNKHIPHEYLTSSRKQRMELLAGLIDTDGTMDKREERILLIIQKNKKLAEQIVFLCRSLGMNASMSLVIKSYTWNGIKKAGEYWQVHVGRITETIPTRLKRKTTRQIDNSMDLNFGFDVIPLKEDRFYGFSLDGNQLFLLGDFTVTHNTGKDFFTAMLILYFLSVFNNSRAAATANSAKQLRSVLWSQIARVMELSVKININGKDEMPILKYLFEYQSEKVYLKEHKGTICFCEAVTCNATMTVEEQAEVLGGRHAKYMLLLADEATGIPDGVFKPLEGTLTGAVNLLFLIFNPTKTKGFAIDSQYGDSDRWIALRWNAEESEIVTKSSIQTMEQKYGRDSTPFRIRVLGLPPVADSDALIPFDWIDEAIKREIKPFEHDPVIMALDCGAGGDNSILVSRQGGKVSQFKRNNSPDSMNLVGWAANNMEGSDALIVDKKGIGHAIYGRLAEVKGWRVKPYDGSTKARNEDRFDRRRDEVYMKMRERFEKGVIDIPDDSDFINQLSAIKVKYDSRGRMHVVTKEQVKKAIGHSPDEVDALAMTFDVDDETYRQTKEDPDDRRERIREERYMQRQPSKYAWAGA